MRKPKKFKKISQDHPELSEWQSLGSNLIQPNLLSLSPMSVAALPSAAAFGGLHPLSPGCAMGGLLPNSPGAQSLPRQKHEQRQYQVPGDTQQEDCLEEAKNSFLSCPETRPK